MYFAVLERLNSSRHPPHCLTPVVRQCQIRESTGYRKLGREERAETVVRGRVKAIFIRVRNQAPGSGSERRKGTESAFGGKSRI